MLAKAATPPLFHMTVQGAEHVHVSVNAAPAEIGTMLGSVTVAVKEPEPTSSVSQEPDA
jgi:predicted sugar kinase